jgi:hypothetical protein
MLVKTSGTASILPGAGPACQPTTLIPAATACWMIGACSAASMVPRMMPSGLSAIACVSAEVRAGTEPCPSRTRNSQPITLAASCAPSPTPLAPPFF